MLISYKLEANWEIRSTSLTAQFTITDDGLFICGKPSVPTITNFRIFKFGHKEERLAQITTGLGKPHPGDTIPLLKSPEFDVPGP